MKKILFVALVLFISLKVNSQINVKDILNKVNLKGPVTMPDSLQMRLVIEQILQDYGKSFNYYDELRTGNYKLNFRKNKNEAYSIEINGKDKERIEIKINCQVSPLGGYILNIDNEDLERLITPNKKAIGFSSQQIESISIIVSNDMLKDQEILPFDDLQPEERKILDRTFANRYKDQNDDELNLYKLCQTGALIPYSSGHSKLITLDNQYHSIIYFDEGAIYDEKEPFNRCYGYHGDDKGEFMNPMGLCVGRMTAIGNEDIYPVYVADMYNLRIRKVNFVADRTFEKYGTFDGNSFRDIAIVTYPYDVCYFRNSTDSTRDKLWVTQTHPFQNFLTCLYESGTEAQRFTGYKIGTTGPAYSFEPGTLTRIGVYDYGFGALCFIDNKRNWLVSCLLNEDGTGQLENISYRDDYIIAANVVSFPMGEPLNSISFHKTPQAGADWPSLWVTSGSYIHHLKMNKGAGVQYIASTNLPRNSLEGFTNMRNVICLNGVYDMYSIENWSYSRGIRKFYPFCDIHSAILENYCNDSTDLMKFKATFTNDCWLYLKAYRKNRQGGWELVKIKKFNGETLNDTAKVKWQKAGWNQADEGLYIDLSLDLDFEDYSLGGQVKLVIQMYPEYYVLPANLNSEHLTLEYTTDVKKTCLPKPGGCPFLYVKDENLEFKVDNNLLHRSEFSTPETDIRDLYKLQINPTLSNHRQVEAAIVENENDLSYINQLKMYAIDYPIGKKLAITEGNDIVLYDSSYVTASDSVMRYAGGFSFNATNNINYHNPGSPIVASADDSMYANFSYGDKRLNSKNKDNSKRRIDLNRAKAINSNKSDIRALLNVAFISDLSNIKPLIPAVKDTVGNLIANSVNSEVFTGIFSRRELNSTVVLPLFQTEDLVDNFKIHWQSDFKMKNLGVAYLEY